jgi:Rap1a immunity proteins
MVTAAALCLWSYASCAGEVVGTGNYLLLACKRAVSDANGHASYLDAFNEGYCVGKIAMVMTLASAELLGHRICPPKGAIADQGVRVVVAFLEANPQRLHEPFSFLAYEALARAWPCKE